MDYQTMLDVLGLHNKVLAITRLAQAPDAGPIGEGCTLAALKRALEGEALIMTGHNMKCRGSCTGFGFTDGIPDMPGGFGYFLSTGRGEGFPPGERVKKTPAMGEEMLLAQPQAVMTGYQAIRVAPYEEGMDCCTVTALVNPDQLSALIHLFNYEKIHYDNVIAPMVSGCASVFRIPFGELERGEAARAVIGNVDVFSRPHFPADTFLLTVPGAAFRRMIGIAGESVLVSPIWKGVGKRIQAVRGMGQGEIIENGRIHFQ